MELPSASPDTMAALFRATAARYPRSVAIETPGVRMTFAELDEQSDALARDMMRRGIGHGAIVGALLLDSAAMIALLIATAKLGAVILTMNWRLAARELSVIMDDADPAIVIVSDCFADLAEQAAPERPRVLVPADAPIRIADPLPGDAGRQQANARDIAADDDWLLLYTSGTTGRPKGCRHSQGGYRVNALSYRDRARFREDERALQTQPLFHVGGLHNFLAIHSAGGCIIVPPRGLDHEATVRLASAERITFQTIPMLDPRGYLDTHRRLALPTRLRLLHGGGGMHPPDLLRDLADAFGADMLLGYGQSEAGGLISLISLAEQLERPTSCGTPLAHVDVRIVGPDGIDVCPGLPGELLIRAASVTKGYLNMPDETHETLAGGWLRTGDVFRRDEAGFLVFAGRTKELIKTGGENVYPAEVEAVIRTHPAVRACCVAGVPDARYGEAVKAFVVLTEGGHASPREIAQWCRGRIAGYKRPRFVEFVDAIPCDFQSKPQRAELSQRPISPEQLADGA